MAQLVAILGLLAIALLPLWAVIRHFSGRAQRKHSTLLQQENADLRKVISEMAMEKHRSHERTRGQGRR